MPDRPKIIVTTVTLLALGGLGAIALGSQPAPDAPAPAAATSASVPEPVVEVRTETIRRTERAAPTSPAPSARMVSGGSPSAGVSGPATTAVRPDDRSGRGRGTDDAHIDDHGGDRDRDDRDEPGDDRDEVDDDRDDDRSGHDRDDHDEDDGRGRGRGRGRGGSDREDGDD